MFLFPPAFEALAIEQWLMTPPGACRLLAPTQTLSQIHFRTFWFHPIGCLSFGLAWWVVRAR
jgi:hypothetical protein